MREINEFTHEENQTALDIVKELMQWKLFEIDCDTVAAKKINRQFYRIELENKYIEITKKRLQNIQLELVI